MSEPLNHTLVDHPLWSRFLRWCTICPKRHERPSNSDLVSVTHETSALLESLSDYQHISLPDPQSYIRLLTLLPDKFDNDVRVTIAHHALTPPSGKKPSRVTLAEIRRDLPSDWEAFQTVSKGRNSRAARSLPTTYHLTYTYYRWLITDISSETRRLASSNGNTPSRIFTLKSMRSHQRMME